MYIYIWAAVVNINEMRFLLNEASLNMTTFRFCSFLSWNSLSSFRCDQPLSTF